MFDGGDICIEEWRGDGKVFSTRGWRSLHNSPEKQARILGLHSLLRPESQTLSPSYSVARLARTAGALGTLHLNN